MSSDDIDTMLDNLNAIKNGEDPRSSKEDERPDDEATTVTSPSHHPETEARLQSDDGLELMKGEVDRLYDEYPHLEDELSRQDVWCGVSRNDGRNGVCKYGKRLTKRRFNKQITQTERASGNVIIVVNEKILEQGNRDEFLDTVRHELAHAVCFGKHTKYPSRQKHHDYDPYYKGHGEAWKQMAAKLGADPSSTHHKRDRSNEYKYMLGCPNCGNEWGKTKRSKVIKQPFNRKCQCGHSPLSSYDAGDEMPDEGGIVAVESLPWDDKSGWYDAGMP